MRLGRYCKIRQRERRMMLSGVNIGKSSVQFPLQRIVTFVLVNLVKPTDVEVIVNDKNINMCRLSDSVKM
jgi:hypothetical protein